MRSGVCTVQHALTPEASSVVKHSLSLARRRGHAQLTPLHVAATLLSGHHHSLRRAGGGGAFLNAAALDLCFNVALNRLPTASASLHHAPPQLSNALVAALKRAQAHHRRSDQNQSSAMVPRVDPEQLLLSILDDPSVSRVMREAGISSAAVKSSLQNSSFWSSGETPRRLNNTSSEIDLILDLLFRRKNNAVIITTDHNPVESLIGDLAARLDLRRTKLLRLRFSPVNGEADVAELRRSVEVSLEAGIGALVYVGDLRWTVEIIGDWVDRAVEEIRTMIISGGDEKMMTKKDSRVWLIGNANRETFFKLQMRKPSLQSLWDLQPLSLPSFALYPNPISVQDSRIILSQQNPTQLITIGYNRDHTIIHEDHYRQSHYYNNNNNNDNNIDNDKLGFCSECASNCEKETEMIMKKRTGNQKLPAWLQPHGTKNPQKDAELVELRRKWIRLCQRLHQQNDKTNTYYFPWPSPYNNHNNIPNNNNNSNETLSSIEFGHHRRRSSEKAEQEERNNITTLALGQSDRRSTPDQESMTRILRENVPWQSEAIPSIVRAVTERRRAGDGGSGDSSWLLVRGSDVAAKARLARAIAESLHGSFVVVSEPESTKLLSSSRGTLMVVLVEDLRLVNALASRSTVSGPTVFVVADNNHPSTSTSSSSSKGVIQMRLEVGEPVMGLLGLDGFGLGLGLGLGRTKKRQRLEEEKDKKSNALDLNKEASPEDEDHRDQETTISPNSSDLTRESTGLEVGPSFAETIEDVFVFDRSPARDREAKEGFEAKMTRCFDESMMMIMSSSTANSKEEIRFRVDESVLKEVSFGCGCFTESVFEKWVQGVFRNALKTVRLRGKEKEIIGCGGGVIGGGLVVRLSLGGGEKEYGGFDLVDGFMGSCLPNKILISYNHSNQ